MFITTNFYKLFLFEYYFINNFFKNKYKILLQKCGQLLNYLYLRLLLFMYFSFNKIYSKLILIYLIIQYLIIYSIFTYKFFYFNSFLTDNLFLFNNILLENYSIIENINYNKNRKLKKKK